MDIPRIFTVSESRHRIHNPVTPEKYATLGRVLRMKPGARILDPGSGSGEMLRTWARDYGITDTGVDMSPLFTEQAKRRAAKLGVSESVHFIHNDAAGYVANEKCDITACIEPPGLAVANQERWDRDEAAKWLTLRRWLEENPYDGFVQDIRAELTIAPKRYVTYTRECFGRGGFALIAR